MPVQHEVGRRIVGQECGDVLDQFSHLTCQGRSLDLKRGVTVAMHDLAESYVAYDRFGQKERVECDQQPVLFGEFVGELKSIGDKLGSTAPTFGSDPFNGSR